MTILRFRDRGSFAHVSMVLLLAWILTGCKSPASNPVAQSLTGSVQHNFPEFFLEKGSDEDSSYISFRGRHAGNDSLRLEMTTWGVVEYGLFLERQNSHVSASFTLMGRCGTVLTRTWKRVTLMEDLSQAEQDTLWKMSFSNWRDTLTIVKTTTTDDFR